MLSFTLYIFFAVVKLLNDLPPWLTFVFDNHIWGIIAKMCVYRPLYLPIIGIGVSHKIGVSVGLKQLVKSSRCRLLWWNATAYVCVATFEFWLHFMQKITTVCAGLYIVRNIIDEFSWTYERVWEVWAGCLWGWRIECWTENDVEKKKKKHWQHT